MSEEITSPLATDFLRHEDVPNRTEKVYGIVVHTTGRTIVEKAISKGLDPLKEVSDFYLEPSPMGGHYTVGYDGTIIQIAGEQERMWHVGLNRDERRLFHSGEWEKKVSYETLQHWKGRWPTVRSPSHLYPGTSVNNVYVGIECLPLTKLTEYTPHNDTWYTKQQHESVRALAMDIAKRHYFPEGWHKTGRFVGHEDVNPLRRSDKGGGWDPGALRSQPRWDWNWLYDRLPGGQLWG